MSTGKKTVPEIRFSGFSEPWAQRKLGDMGSTFTGLSGKTKEDFGHGDAKFITYMNVYTNAVADLTMTEPIEVDSKQNKVKAGDVFFTTSSETPEEVGMSCVMPANMEDTYLNSFCFGYRQTERLDLNYLAYALRSNSFREQMVFLAQGISRYNISKNKVMEAEIAVPSSDEQSQIGSIFESLDSLISQHQHKYDALVSVKKAMLEKMFPKEGETVPEIRFTGFTDPWEQRKLGDMAKYRNGKAHENDISEQGKFIVVNSKFVSTNGEVRKFSNKQIEPLFKNEIAFVLSDVPNGRAIARTFLVDKNDKYTLNQRIAGITPIEGVCPYFLHILMNRNKYFLQFDDGAKQTNLSVNDVIEFAEYYPSSEEQQQIGSYFRNLDHLITLHQRKCEVLKNLKSALLNKMFVNTTE